MTAAAPQSTSSLAPRAMWLIALILAVGILSLATAALPGRARPLFVLPLVFGVASAGLSIILRRSLLLACSTPVWLVTTALALGGYGQVVASTFQKFQSQTSSTRANDQEAAIAIEMLKGTEHNAMAEEMEKDLAARRSGWDLYLSHRYASLGTRAPRFPTLMLAIEAILVIGGVGIGRRFLDGNHATCQSAGPAAGSGDGSTSS
jgi:hypothetical protein